MKRVWQPWVIAIALATSIHAQSSDERTDTAGLIERLGAENARDRNHAYRQLQRERPADLPQVLEARLEALPHHGRQLASNLLRNLSIEQRRHLDQRLIESDHPYVRAIGAAGRIRLCQQTGDQVEHARAIEAMASAVRACDVRVELGAILQELGAAPDALVVDALVGRLSPDLSSSLVGQILQRLQPSQEDQAIESAVRALSTSEDRRVRAIALAFLVRAHRDAVEPLIELIEKHTDTLQPAMTQLQGAARLDPRLLEALLRRFPTLRSPQELTQLTRLLAPGSASRVARQLAALVDDDDSRMADGAATQLSRLARSLSDETARELLASPAPLARVLAADCLRRRDDRSGLPAVLDAASTAGSHRAETARVLGEFRSREAVPVLLGLMDDANVKVRSHAWTAVQKTLQSLYPFRRFDFSTVDYDPNALDRSAAMATLRRYWKSLERQRR